MNKGKVIIIGGNKRAGKTTLTMKLHKEYNFNYYNFDMLLDSLEESFQVLQDQSDEIVKNMVLN
jgi:deoxyadenosine/deoxycytidine kinase